MIFTNYSYKRDKNQDEDRELITGGNENKKRSNAGRILRWIIYSVCIFIFTSVIFRIIATGTPKELQNFIIKSESVQKAYSELKDGLRIYRIDVRIPFSMGDALFADNVYHIENADNLQVTLRCKNSRFKDMTGDAPFKVVLTVFTEEERDEEGVIYGTTLMINPSDYKPFNKYTDNYRYFVYSFDGVIIDYLKSVVYLYVFYGDEEKFPDEDYAIARYTILDSMTPRVKMQAKKFNLG